MIIVNDLEPGHLDYWSEFRTMSIRLTVLGVTRREFGYVAKGKAEPFKELFSDALARAAMRFGVALELWSKTDLESHADESDGGGAPDGGESPGAQSQAAPVKPCPLCGFDLTNQAVKKQDGAYVHRTCPSGGSASAPLPAASEGDTGPARPRPQDSGGEGASSSDGAREPSPPEQTELPSDENRDLHAPPDPVEAKGRVSELREQLGEGA